MGYGYTADVAVDTAGNIYLATESDGRILRIDANGRITTVAGTGVSGFSGDGVRADRAQLSNPVGVAIDAAGNVYIADEGNSRVRRVDTGGKITTFAGNGIAGFSGDNGPATRAQLELPVDVALDAAGNLYIVDLGGYRVRRVGTDGRITTVAGTGETESSGGGLATQADIVPSCVAVDTVGNIFISEYGYRVRRVGTDRQITTVAGTGVRGFTGDGGPADQAQLGSATCLTVDTIGNLYIADRYNHRVRKVDTKGRITTVAGNGVQGSDGDGGRAIQAQLDSPDSVDVDAAGNLYIEESGRIRRVGTDGIITTVID